MLHSRKYSSFNCRRSLVAERLELRLTPSGMDVLGASLANGLGADLAAGQYRIVATDEDTLIRQETATGAGLDGVVSLEMMGNFGGVENETWNCSGALLTGGRHVLTAGHCLIGEDDGMPYRADEVTVTFDTPHGTAEIVADADGLHWHPEWESSNFGQSDLAVISLPYRAPKSAEQYEINRSVGDDVGVNGLKVGYGLKGTGANGAERYTYGTKRYGWNRYDIADANILFYDFDDRTTDHDALGQFGLVNFGSDILVDLGLGSFEVNTAKGDSGGPTFVDGRIAGVTSKGGPLNGGIADINDKSDSSFGEYSVDTRVATHAGWIDEIVAITTIDDGDAGFAQSGWWGQSGLKGYDGDSSYSYSGSATYSFADLADGWYEISVNTPGKENSSDRAQYTIASGGKSVETVLDQRVGTHGWLGIDTVQVVGGELTVEISQIGNGVLRADAMRVERVAKPAITTIDDGDAGFSQSGWWGQSGLKGYAGDSSYSYSGSATYSFANLYPGTYDVLVNTPGKENSSDRAQYTIESDGQTVETVLDQRVGTHGWLTLTSFEVPVGASSLNVTVAQSGSGVLRADAIRVVGATGFFRAYAEELDAYLEFRSSATPQSAVAAESWTLSAPQVRNLAAGSFKQSHSNLDAVFGSKDVDLVFQAGEYEDDLVLNSTFEEADWNGDNDFKTANLVKAFQSDVYTDTSRLTVRYFARIVDLLFDDDRRGKMKSHDPQSFDDDCKLTLCGRSRQ